MKKRILAWLAVLLVIPFLGITATTSTASADCESGSVTGDDKDGTWTRDYDAGCNGVNVGRITITWHNYTQFGHRIVKYDMSVWSGQTNGTNCIQAALDWAPHINSGTGHSDAQIMRNCDDYTTREMDTQLIDLDQFCNFANPGGSLCSSAAFPVNRLQVGTYNGDDILTPECPNVADGTADDTDCNNWNPAPPFNAVYAKIRRRTSSGDNGQNNPQWPGDYDVRYMVSPSA